MAESEYAISPKTGDMYRCDKCSLEIHITQGCDCDPSTTEFKCCGQPLALVTSPPVVDS